MALAPLTPRDIHSAKCATWSPWLHDCCCTAPLQGPSPGAAPAVPLGGGPHGFSTAAGSPATSRQPPPAHSGSPAASPRFAYAGSPRSLASGSPQSQPPSIAEEPLAEEAALAAEETALAGELAAGRPSADSSYAGQGRARKLESAAEAQQKGSRPAAESRMAAAAVSDVQSKCGPAAAGAAEAPAAAAFSTPWGAGRSSKESSSLGSSFGFDDSHRCSSN